ncbi:MAG: hypothetical protein QW728_07535 [Thermoplasmata archaeon]
MSRNNTPPIINKVTVFEMNRGYNSKRYTKRGTLRNMYSLLIRKMRYGREDESKQDESTERTGWSKPNMNSALHISAIMLIIINFGIYIIFQLVSVLTGFGYHIQ